MASIQELVDQTEEKMLAAIEALEKDYSAFRTGKASPGLVENIMVDYYGTASRLRDIASISTPEARLIVIQPWDKNALTVIEKTIHSSDLGISPVNDGRLIRIPVPELSEERRQELTKQVKKRAEAAKVEIRNHRRDANDEAKSAQKNSEATEDDLSNILHSIQKLTDDYIQQIESLTGKKEKELLQV